MTTKTMRPGYTVRTYEKGDGMRRRFYDMLEPRYFTFPRKIPKNRTVGWYFDGHLVERPLFGVYAAGRIAEHIMYLLRAKKLTGDRAAFSATAAVYAKSRRMMESVVRHTRIDDRLPKAWTDSLRKELPGFFADARAAYELVKNTRLTPRAVI